MNKENKWFVMKPIESPAGKIYKMKIRTVDFTLLDKLKIKFRSFLAKLK